MNKKELIFVVYDGIENPVFQGQVLQPLLNELAMNPDLKIHLIAFEKGNFSDKQLSDLIPENKNLNFIKFKRFPVLGKFSLWHSVLLLKKFLNGMPSYSLKARGPFASWISLKAIDYKRCTSFTVQARGLVAVEYNLFYSTQNIFKLIFHKLRKMIFERIENEIYNPKKIPENFCIESISFALSDYLVDIFKAKKEFIKLAINDFPKKINEVQKENWRKKIRSELKIPDDFYIYCYNGSTKPWQALDLTINFFKDKIKTERNVFLLVLTQEKAFFEKLLKDEQIDSRYYVVLKVKHQDIYQYLSACDTGLIFRKDHLANWISRPIKAMEYQAVGLKIQHNNTVKWLIDQDVNFI